MCLVHTSKSLRLPPGALVEEACVHDPNQAESQLAKLFPMLAGLTATQHSQTTLPPVLKSLFLSGFWHFTKPFPNIHESI